MKQANLLVVLVSALSVASIFLTYTLFTFFKSVQYEAALMKKKEYSMSGDDWPPFFPLNLERKIEMVVEESVHFIVGGPGATDEWRYQRGFGFDGAARLGVDQNRTFAVSLYHQAHCLVYLHAQLTSTATATDRRLFSHHQHCLNYLRQQALCHPDLTLEPGDFTTRDLDLDRAGQTHTCRDFETAWDKNTENWLGWYHFLRDTRITSQLSPRD